MKLKSILGITLLGLLLLESCASTPKFSGKGDLCGMIVDEKNVPVKDFVITCVSSKGNIGKAVTNEGGVFAVKDMPAGKYSISGEKVGYARITGEHFTFDSREKFFCCKVNSSRAAMDAAENQLKCGNYELAIKLLDEIYCEKDSVEEVSVWIFQAYAHIKAGNKKEAQKYISKLKKNKFSKDSSLVITLEEQINGME